MKTTSAQVLRLQPKISDLKPECWTSEAEALDDSEVALLKPDL